MSTPTKKRKKTTEQPERGSKSIKSFFGGKPSQTKSDVDPEKEPKRELEHTETDEELARRLQAEWDAEATESLQPTSPAPRTETPSETKPYEALAEQPQDAKATEAPR
ncbi:hypothetical protein KEM55_009187, partial [Ascosphaera atra]